MLETAKKAAVEGGKTALGYYKKEISFQKKEDESFFSEADIETEKAIRKIIKKKYPGHAILGEEEGKKGSGSITWHVDPIDGTSNFKSHVNYFCTSVGIEKDGRFVIGAIYNPITKDLYYAEEGKGAFLNGKRIKTTNSPLKEGIKILNFFWREKNALKKLKLIEQVMATGARFRMFGATALELAELAAGKYVICITDNARSYDFAAGIVIAREAGAVVSDVLGNKADGKTRKLLAANNKENHKKLLEITKPFYAKY